MKPRKWQLTSRVQLLFEPADLWVGAFWDRVRRRLFLLPVPMFGLVIQFRIKTSAPAGTVRINKDTAPSISRPAIMMAKRCGACMQVNRYAEGFGGLRCGRCGLPLLSSSKN